MAAMFAPSRSSQALRHAVSATQAASNLPGFLVPAWQTASRTSSNGHCYQQQPLSARQLSTTSRCQSKLGRTPITVPPGVELMMGEPREERGSRDWKPRVTKDITINGPLGTELPFLRSYQFLSTGGENRRACSSRNNY